MNGENDPKQTVRRFRAVAMLSSVGLTLALSVGVGGGIGYALDRWLGTKWLVILFTILGVIAGFQQLIRAVIQANADQERMDAEDAAARRSEKKLQTPPDDPRGRG
jgi:F0F1-type ATP synthase assembly protein I